MQRAREEEEEEDTHTHTHSLTHREQPPAHRGAARGSHVVGAAAAAAAAAAAVRRAVLESPLASAHGFEELVAGGGGRGLQHVGGRQAQHLDDAAHLCKCVRECVCV